MQFTQKLPKSPLGENLPNLVTLQTTDLDRMMEAAFGDELKEDRKKKTSYWNSGSEKRECST
jgi:hypothetical protein